MYTQAFPRAILAQTRRSKETRQSSGRAPADQPLEDPDGWNPDEELAWQEQLEEDTCTTES